jgi:hypothetical protein
MVDLSVFATGPFARTGQRTEDEEVDAGGDGGVNHGFALGDLLQNQKCRTISETFPFRICELRASREKYAPSPCRRVPRSWSRTVDT